MDVSYTGKTGNVKDAKQKLILGFVNLNIPDYLISILLNISKLFHI